MEMNKNEDKKIELSKAEIMRKLVKEHYYRNKEKKLASVMEYRKKNPEKYMEYQRAYYYKKRQEKEDKIKRITQLPNLSFEY